MNAMTDLLSRPILRVGAAKSGPLRPIALSAAIAAAWVAAVGLVVCVATSVVVWFFGSSGRFGSAIEVGALGWLVGNGAGVQVGELSITAIPVGFLALVAWGLHRAGRWAGSSSAMRWLGDVALGAFVMAATYAALGLVAAAMARPGVASAGIARVVVIMSLVGLVFGGLGLLRGSGLSGDLLDLLPEEVRAALAGGVAGALTLLAVAGLVTTVSLVTHFSSALRLAEGMHAGLLGGVILAAIGVLAVPNAVLSAVSFLAGPGFVVGTGTIVSPDNVSLGRLPAFPLLAALPRGGAPGWWATALVAVPVVAGVVSALVALRKYPAFGIDRAALRGGVAGLSGGLLVGASTWLASGSVGPGRMQDVGPDAGTTTLVCAAAFGLGGAMAGAGLNWISTWWEEWRGSSSAGASQDDGPTAPVPRADS